MGYIILLLFLIGIIYYVGRILKFNLIGEIIIAIVFGIFWEITTAPLWAYDPVKLTEVKLMGMSFFIEIILGWGFNLGCVILLTYIIQLNFLKRTDDVAYFFAGLISILFVSVPIEYFGYISGLWVYTHPETVFQGVALGWLFFGTLFLATIKVYEDEIEKWLK